jgi:hypothetical protein
VLDLAEGGDPFARAVVTESARQHGADVIGIARQLRLGDEPVTVVAAGGVHASAGPAFSRPFAEVVTDALPGASIELLVAPPVAGAALLALDTVGAMPPESVATLLDSASAARTDAVNSGRLPSGARYGTAT